MPAAPWLLRMALLLLAAPLVLAGPRICAVDGTSKLVAVRGPCPVGSSRTRVAGVNIFDAMWDASTPMGSPHPRGRGGISIANTTAALAAAADNKIRVFRMFAALWGPAMRFWVTNETQYWSEFDPVMDMIAAHGLHVIPSIGYSDWWWTANEAFPGLNETLNDFIMNASSVSRGLATKYFTQIVTRYAKRDCVLLWELGNELNLQVNLPPPKCHPTAKCFGHAAMTAFTADAVGIIRSIDPRRPISSGLSTPRNGAWHMEHCEPSGCPPGVPGGFWGPDTKEQWQEALTEQQKGTDYWSIHLYDDRGRDGGHCYFSPDKGPCAALTDVISAASSSAASADAGLFLGEYGGPAPNFTGPTKADQAFPSAALQLQVAQAKAAPDASMFDLTAIWMWMGASHRSDMVGIWPDSSDPKESGSKAMLDLILQADAALTGPAAPGRVGGGGRHLSVVSSLARCVATGDPCSDQAPYTCCSGLSCERTGSTKNPYATACVGKSE